MEKSLQLLDFSCFNKQTFHLQLSLITAFLSLLPERHKDRERIRPPEQKLDACLRVLPLHMTSIMPQKRERVNWKQKVHFFHVTGKWSLSCKSNHTVCSRWCLSCIYFQSSPLCVDVFLFFIFVEDFLFLLHFCLFELLFFFILGNGTWVFDRSWCALSSSHVVFLLPTCQTRSLSSVALYPCSCLANTHMETCTSPYACRSPTHTHIYSTLPTCAQLSVWISKNKDDYQKPQLLDEAFKNADEPQKTLHLVPDQPGVKARYFNMHRRASNSCKRTHTHAWTLQSQGFRQREEQWQALWL